MTLTELAKSRPYKAMKPPHYLDVYEQYWARIRNNPVKLMEVGIAQGGSLKLWRDYFPNGDIFGIDANPAAVALKLGPRIKKFLANQTDSTALTKIAIETGPYDIVIDDGAHTGYTSLTTFISLFPAVVPGGLYIIEDWGTGYWKHWPDGSEAESSGNFTIKGNEFLSHQSGMVGFVKQLIDVCNTLDRTMGADCSQINSMELMPGMVLLRKRTAGELEKSLNRKWYRGQ